MLLMWLARSKAFHLASGDVHFDFLKFYDVSQHRCFLDFQNWGTSKKYYSNSFVDFQNFELILPNLHNFFQQKLRVFIGSDSGSSLGDVLHQGVYENFRRELEMSSSNRENLEEANSALSDEQSSGTLSSPGQSDILLTAAQGTVRKAGALAVKNFLVHKKNKKVESATRRKWKHYWVSLKGCTLFFYESDSRSGIDNNSIPKHAVWVENSIVQAVPEHPKKDFVFCLSNSLGDAFLFQTSSQTELENWITAIHSACATTVARQHHKEDTVKLLKSEIKKLEQKIDMDEKMKKMGEMQLSSVTDAKKKKTILDQIFVWEQNLEQFQMDLFRYRCYLASLQGGELPNPKRLLAFASRPTKVAMGRLGIFSVSSFHALVSGLILYTPHDISTPLDVPSATAEPLFEELCQLSSTVRAVTSRDVFGNVSVLNPWSASCLLVVRMDCQEEQVAARTGESGVRRRTQAMSRSASKRRSRFSSLWGLDTSSKKKQGRPSINQVFNDGSESVKKSLEGIFDETASEDKKEKEVVALTSVHPHNPDADIWVHEYLTPSWVSLPNEQSVLMVIHPEDTARDALEFICKTHKLDYNAHYLRLKFLIDNQPWHYIPKHEEEICELLYKEIEICPKCIKCEKLEKINPSDNFGFSLCSVEEDGRHHLYVSNVRETGLAFKKGRTALYLAPSIFPSTLTSFSVPAEEKYPHSRMPSPPCLTATRLVEFSICPSSLGRAAGFRRRQEVQKKKSSRETELGIPNQRHSCPWPGLKIGDEIMEVNSATARDLNSAMLRHLLGKPLLCLTVRTCPDLDDNQTLKEAPPRRSEADGSDYSAFTSSRDLNNPAYLVYNPFKNPDALLRDKLLTSRLS
ncbi:unnamed protein product [Ranitomeya imitator]|uniref:T-lymphoma invasion and metastasis-inducing protein 1 n=1 Tax=Ranitomeya imitator TaxID=111125 RepID=A0ABN9MW40_9NEOB|nr:unnamed protein product [Ranitomeya imitator]